MLGKVANDQKSGEVRLRCLRVGVVVAGLFVSQVAAQPGVTLDFPTWQAEEPGPAAFWTEAVAAFEAGHPGVAVKKYQVPFREYVDKMTVRFSGGAPPDIVHLPLRNFPSFAAQGWLRPLDDQIAKTDIKATYSPMAAETEWGGHAQGVLMMGYGMLLFYNQALLDAAGVAVPTTPDELLAAIRATTSADKGIFGWGATTSEHPNIFVDWLSWTTGVGAPLFTSDGYNFTSPAVLAAMEQFRAAAKSAPRGVSTEAMRQLFLDGKIAMFREGAFFASQLGTAPAATRGSLKAAMMPFPVVPGGTSNSMHIAASLDPARAQLVWEFIQMLSTPDWQARYTLALKVPAPRRGAFTPAMAAADPLLALSARASEAAVNIFPQAPKVRLNYNQIARLVGESGIRLINSDRPTAAILKDLQDTLNRRVPLQ